VEVMLVAFIVAGERKKTERKEVLQLGDLVSLARKAKAKCVLISGKS